MEWGILFVVLLGLVLGFIVLQASFAARHWRRVIADGDPDALREALDVAFEAWREQQPPKELPPADWQGLLSAALIAADRDRCRVSVLVDADVRVVENHRRELGGATDVARRVAVRMVERLLYEIPHVRFDEVQVDAYRQLHGEDAAAPQQCVLTTRVTRERSAESNWDRAEPAQLLADWRTHEASAGAALDPDAGALIVADEPGAVLAIEDMIAGDER